MTSGKADSQCLKLFGQTLGTKSRTRGRYHKAKSFKVFVTCACNEISNAVLTKYHSDWVFYTCRGKMWHYTRQINKWFVLSSRPADSLEEFIWKSSYPSPPLMIRISLAGAGAFSELGSFSLGLSSALSFGTSTAVRNLTWPVCPWKEAVAAGQFRKDDVLAVIVGSGNVKTTPALVPIHNRSLHPSSDVTRKQAALCWRMMASEPKQLDKKCIRKVRGVGRGRGEEV